MPEMFSTILEELADEGRGRMGPFATVASIRAEARSRRLRRQGILAAASGVVACAVAVNVMLGTGGLRPSSPSGGATPAPVTTAAKATKEPPNGPPATFTKFVDHEPPALYLQPTELPWQSTFHWQANQVGAMTIPEPPENNYFGDIPCGSSPNPVSGLSRSISDTSVQYLADGAQDDEYIYRYADEAAAIAEYHELIPSAAKCASSAQAYGFTTVTARQTAAIPNGFAWFESGTAKLAPGSLPNGTTIRRSELYLIVQYGNTIAKLTAGADDGDSANTDAEDAAVLQTMAARLAGHPPVTPPAKTSPTTPGFVTEDQLPFPTADGANGWVPMTLWGASTPGTTPPSDPCTNLEQGLVNGTDSVSYSETWHGSATKVPYSPTELYSSAEETDHVFDTAEDAVAAFNAGEKAAAIGTCQTKQNGSPLTLTVKPGPATTTTFSIAVRQTDGSSNTTYNHIYIALKGRQVAVTSILMSSSAGYDTSNDAPFLAAMAARLP